ncbi:TPA: hypothetical protein ACH3X3_013014 [Trebouxia sp. C0006]
MIPILDQLYTAPQGFITTPASPLVSCTPPLPSPRTAAAGQPPTSSSAFLSKTPSYVHQQSGQVASQTASPSVRVQKLSNSPMTYAEKAAAPAASAAAGSQPPAPNRSNQCLHGIRSTDQVPDALSASFLDADDKPLCSTAGKNALSAALGGSCCFSCCCSRLDSCQQQPSRLQDYRQQSGVSLLRNPIQNTLQPSTCDSSSTCGRSQARYAEPSHLASTQTQAQVQNQSQSQDALSQAQPE